MKPVVKWTLPVVLLVAVMGINCFAQQYAAKITVNGGNSFVVKRLNISGDRLMRVGSSSSTSLSMIKNIEFRFSGVSLKMCESMFRNGDSKALESVLEQNIGPLAQYSYLPTNLGDYLVWLLRTQYWSGNASGALKTVGQIRKVKNPDHVNMASLYYTMILLDQGKLTDAETVFTSLENPDQLSVPMAEYIRGKIALEKEDPRNAMQHVARIIAFYSRDPEWMAPATVLEARIYQHLGHPQKARAVAEELIMAYPGTQWSRLGQQIKNEVTGS